MLQAFIELTRQIGAWIRGERATASIEEMIDSIQDGDQLYFMDYQLKALQNSYLMPDVQRQTVQFVEGEEVECSERQPFHLPAVIKRAHANGTYDVMFFSGEVVKNAFAEHIRLVLVLMMRIVSLMMKSEQVPFAVNA